MMRRLFIVLIALATLVTPLLPAGTALADPFPRGEFRGYFNNQFYNTRLMFVQPDGIHPTYYPLSPTGKPYVESFIQINRSHLNSGAWRFTGVSFLVLTMMGQPPGTSKNMVNSLWNEWESRVRAYSDRDWITWYTTSSITQNTYNQATDYGGVDDIAWFNRNESVESHVFHRPGSAYSYKVEVICSNPLGDLNGLEDVEPVNYDVSLTADRNGTSANVIPGQTYRVGASIVNNGPDASEAGDLQVMFPATGVVQPCAPNCAPAGQNPLTTGTSTSDGFRANSDIPGVSGRNWYWEVGPLPRGRSGDGSFPFTVSPTAAVGSTITFTVYYYRGNAAGAVRQATVTFKVVSARAPGVGAFNSDVHAGGGICDQTLTNGIIKGYPGAGSLGEYVVSASSSNGINDFKSNGTGSDSLRLGQNGSYAQICRPDLVQIANNYRNTSSGYSTRSGADLDVTGLSGIYYLDAPTTTIHGIVGSKLTLVGKNIRISGPLTLSGATFAPRDVPALGIIASGDIRIDAGVTRVDAYMFANGTIDTCTAGTGSCATPQLVVNGFMMARNISFRRLGPLNSNGSPMAEVITLNPQIYLNPPKFFDYSVDQNLLQGQGERQPLF